MTHPEMEDALARILRDELSLEHYRAHEVASRLADLVAVWLTMEGQRLEARGR